MRIGAGRGCVGGKRVENRSYGSRRVLSGVEGRMTYRMRGRKSDKEE